MNGAELRKKSVADLQGELEGLFKEQFRYRMAHSAGQFAQTHKLREVRRNIARIRTVIHEKQKLVKDDE